MSTVPTAKTKVDSPNASSRRANSRRCRSPRVKSLDNSSRITAESPSVLHNYATLSDDASGLSVVFLGLDTVCFVMDPTRAGSVLARHAGIDKDPGQLTPTGAGRCSW